MHSFGLNTHKESAVLFEQEEFCQVYLRLRKGKTGAGLLFLQVLEQYFIKSDTDFRVTFSRGCLLVWGPKMVNRAWMMRGWRSIPVFLTTRGGTVTSASAPAS